MHNEAAFSSKEEWDRGCVESDDDDSYSDCDAPYNDGDLYGGDEEDNAFAQTRGPDMYATTDKEEEEEEAEGFRLNQLLGLPSQYGGTHKFPIALMYGEDDALDLEPHPWYPDYTRNQVFERVIFVRQGYD